MRILARSGMVSDGLAAKRVQHVFRSIELVEVLEAVGTHGRAISSGPQGPRQWWWKCSERYGFWDCCRQAVEGILEEKDGMKMLSRETDVVVKSSG